LRGSHPSWLYSCVIDFLCIQIQLFNDNRWWMNEWLWFYNIDDSNHDSDHWSWNITSLSLSLLTESVQNIQAGKAGKVTGLIRVVHLLNQNKVMVSLNPITSSSLLFLSSSSISSYPSSLSWSPYMICISS